MLTREERERLKRLVDRRTRDRLGVVSPELFLRDTLEDGHPRRVDELIREARARGITLDALREAKRRLRIDGGRDDPFWRLPLTAVV